MSNKAPEQQLLDESRTRRQIFQLRFCEYSHSQRLLTAKLVFDIAQQLSREIGRMPDNFIFGRDVLTASDAEKFLDVVSRVQQEAEDGGPHEKVTACLALKALAGLVVLRHRPAPASVAMQAEHAFGFVLQIMEELAAESEMSRAIHTERH